MKDIKVWVDEWESISKTSEFEIHKHWKEYANMAITEPVEEGDSFKEGDMVMLPEGVVGIIKECCGKNKLGTFEYFVKWAGSSDEKYYTDNQLKLMEQDLPPIPTTESRCTHPNAYKNVISKNLQFWVCPDCKQEVEDPSIERNMGLWLEYEGFTK